MMLILVLWWDWPTSFHWHSSAPKPQSSFISIWKPEKIIKKHMQICVYRLLFFFLLSAVLKLRAVDRGVLVIQGTRADRYLAMSDEGRLYSSVSIYSLCRIFLNPWYESMLIVVLVTATLHHKMLCPSQPTVNDECYFLEKMEENHYNTYQPQKYQERNWYVALKKNGKPKLGPRTHIGQKAIFFLPRQLDESGEWRRSSVISGWGAGWKHPLRP